MKSAPTSTRAQHDARLVEGLRELIARYGDATTAVSAPVVAAVEQLRVALAASAGDEGSLTALEITRIRLGKFAATRLPPALYRDPTRLAALRAEIWSSPACG